MFLQANTLLIVWSGPKKNGDGGGFAPIHTFSEAGKFPTYWKAAPATPSRNLIRFQDLEKQKTV